MADPRGPDADLSEIPSVVAKGMELRMFLIPSTGNVSIPAASVSS